MVDSEQFSALFSQLAKKKPNKPAVRLPGADQTWSFSELERLSIVLAKTFQYRGIAKHDRVVLAFPNCVEFVLSLLAVSKLGAIIVPIAPNMQRNEAEAILADSGTAYVIGGMNSQNTFEDLQPEQINLHDSLTLWLASRTAEDCTETLQNVAMLKYTSGTTGTPKGVMLSHRQIAQEGQNVVETLDLSEQDVILTGASLFHSYGFDFCLMPMLLTGATLLLFAHNLPRRWLRALHEEKVTLFPTVPRLLQLLTKVKQETPYSFANLRYCISATAPLSARTARKFYETFGIVVCQNYGSSEAGAITLEIRRKPDIPSTCLGHALNNLLLEIRNEEGTILRNGEKGEVWVGGEQVAMGYYQDPGLTAEYFLQQRCRTGDIGYLDEQNNLFLTGRKKQFINSGGKKLSPREIEMVLEQHPHITEVAIVGVEDEALGEAVKACVVAERTLTAQELIQFCQSHLSPHKIPQKWSFMEKLPRNQVGKVDTERLKG